MSIEIMENIYTQINRCVYVQNIVFIYTTTTILFLFIKMLFEYMYVHFIAIKQIYKVKLVVTWVHVYAPFVTWDICICEIFYS